MNSRLRILPALLLGISLLQVPATANPNTENESYPYFTTQGRLKLLKAAAGMSIHQIKADSRNRPWVLFEKATASGKRELVLGRITPNRIVERFRLSLKKTGHIHSPDMGFGPEDRPWIVYVHVTPKKQQLIIDKAGSSTPWILQAPHRTPLFSPKLLIDSTGYVWLFWVGRDTGLDEIFYTNYDPAIAAWTEPVSLTQNPAVPHFHPNAHLNGAGRPAVVWSGYDEEDYEIYYSAWEGQDWTRPEKISNNHFCSDAQPSLVFYMGNLPAVAWTHSRSDETMVMFSYKKGRTWQKPARLARPSRWDQAPRLLTQGQNLAISWQDSVQSHARSLVFPPVTEGLPAEKPKRLHVQSPLLERNKFIGFGDSITFGSMNGPYMGIGYTPRLQTLLQGLFHDPLVTNRGVPGEPTWEAVSRIHSVLDNDLALYLLLMEGTNDVSTLDYSLDSVIFNLRQILNASLSRGVFPLISTIIPRARARWTPSAQARTKELNNKIIALASELRVFIVQNYDAFIDFPEAAGGYEALISSDNLHPNDTGYQVMAETWHQKIKFIPFPPIEIKAKKSLSRQRITLTWEDDPRILPSTLLAQYRIYRTTITENSPRLVSTVPASVHTYQDTHVSLDQEYRYFLSSWSDRDREGPLSEVAIPEQGDPFPPLNIASETLVNKAYLYWEYLNQITWEANPLNQEEFQIVSYRIYRKQKGEINSAFRQIAEVSSTEFIYLDRGRYDQAEAEAFEYSVTSVDSEGLESPIGEFD